jgi:DNA repair photolyase
VLTPTLTGRGTTLNPQNRFDKIDYLVDLDEHPLDDPEYVVISPKTTFLKDHSQTLISYNDSPDIPFRAGINPYRGCEHGCIYCYARPYHEYLGLSAGLDFETKIMVKLDAPQLLIKELSAKKYEPQIIAMSGITDVYQPAERHFKLTRQLLKILAEFKNPVGMVTKNHLVTRDLDILKELASQHCVAILVSVTSLNQDLQQILEPRTSIPTKRLEAIYKLNEAGISVAANIAPVIPGLTDHEIPAILKAVREAGAQTASYIPVRLPYAVKDLFENWLEQHLPTQKEKVLNRIREIRGGQLNDPQFGSRMTGSGEYAKHIDTLFESSYRKLNFPGLKYQLTAKNFKPAYGQLGLF